MGFWSALGTIGGLALAPFTGGASAIPALMGAGAGIGGAIDALSNTGQVAGNDAAYAANGRAQQAGIQQNQDRNALALYQDQLAAQQAGINQRGQLASQAGRGDILSNLQDVSFSGLPPGVTVPTISGGLRPSLLGPNARQAGQTMSRQALLQLLSGNPQPQAPTLTPLPQASGYDTFTKGLARAGSYAGALGPLFGGQRPTYPTGLVPGVTDPSQIIGGLTDQGGGNLANIFSGNNDWSWLG